MFLNNLNDTIIKTKIILLNTYKGRTKLLIFNFFQFLFIIIYINMKFDDIVRLYVTQIPRVDKYLP